MKRIAIAVTVLILALVIASGCAHPPAAPAPVIPQASADWPMFRFDVEHTGYNATETVLKPPLELKWKFKAKSKI